MDLRTPQIEDLDLTHINDGVLAAGGVDVRPAAAPKRDMGPYKHLAGGFVLGLLILLYLSPGRVPHAPAPTQLQTQPISDPAPVTQEGAAAMSASEPASEQPATPIEQATPTPVPAPAPDPDPVVEVVRTPVVAKPEAVRTVPAPAPATAPAKAIQPAPAAARPSVAKQVPTAAPQPQAKTQEMPTADKMAAALPPIRKQLPQMPPTPKSEEIPPSPEGKAVVRKGSREDAIRNTDILIPE